MVYWALKQNDQRTWIISFYCKPSKIQPYESDSSLQEIVLRSTNSPHGFNGPLFEENSTQHASQALNNAKSSCISCFQIFVLLPNFKCWLLVANEHLSFPQQIHLFPAKCLVLPLKLLNYYLYFPPLESKKSARGKRLKASTAYLIIKKHNNKGLGADNCPSFSSLGNSFLVLQAPRPYCV